MQLISVVTNNNQIIKISIKKIVPTFAYAFSNSITHNSGPLDLAYTGPPSYEQGK